MDAPVAGNDDGVAESFCLCLRMELPCCLLGDSVGSASSVESGSSILLVVVESVGPAVPTD